MELSIFVVYLIAIVLMIAASIGYFAYRANSVYHDLQTNMPNILKGGLLMGLGTGFVVGFVLSVVLPTYEMVEDTQESACYTRYALNGDFFSEMGKTYIVNDTDVEIYLVGMTYGNKDFDDDDMPISPVPVGYMLATKHSVNGWFELFPDKVSSKSKGEIKWHVMTRSQAEAEYGSLDALFGEEAE